MLRLRYKQPGEDRSRLIETPLYRANIEGDLGKTSDRFRFAAAVAGFGQLLRGGKYVEDFDYPAVLELARKARGADRFGYRGEFIQLVNLAGSLQQQQVRASR